jgi:hypothetical protein
VSRYELLALLGVAVALLILSAVLLRSRSRHKRRPKPGETRAGQPEFQERRPTAERPGREPTELRVELAGPPGERRFVFSNAGPGIARNVNFAFADAGGWSAPVIAAQFRDVFPIREFRPNQKLSCLAALHLGHPAVLTGVYSWEDEDGVKHQTTCRIPS